MEFRYDYYDLGKAQANKTSEVSILSARRHEKVAFLLAELNPNVGKILLQRSRRCFR